MQDQNTRDTSVMFKPAAESGGGQESRAFDSEVIENEQCRGPSFTEDDIQLQAERDIEEHLVELSKIE